MYLLSKLLPLFVLPFGVALILLIWGLVRRKRWPLWTSLLVLLLAGNPLLSNQLTGVVEGGQIRRPAAEAPRGRAIVVLSGSRPTAPGPARISEWTDADRFFGGVELYRAGKAPWLIFTGGASPFDPAAVTEGEILANVATEFGIPRASIGVTGRVVNTAEEAAAVSTWLAAHPGDGPVLLVTSAFHMSRARRLFEREGINVEPFPVDFRTLEFGRSVLNLVPSVSALRNSEEAIRELYGRAYYAVR
jgi:uncharacterized SAM-binding protein YcdF (DUF218 family)